eukprot:3934833-Rhodomonas_salina.1
MASPTLRIDYNVSTAAPTPLTQYRAGPGIVDRELRQYRTWRRRHSTQSHMSKGFLPKLAVPSFLVPPGAPNHYHTPPTSTVLVAAYTAPVPGMA